MTQAQTAGQAPGSDDLTLREARREDVARIAELIMLGAAKATRTPSEIAEAAGDPAHLSGFEQIQASPDNALFVAERGGEVIGTFQVTLIPGIAEFGRKRAKLESVHIAPAERGRGIGRMMIGFAERFARAHGATIIELSSNKSRLDAHRFYRDLGFDQSHEAFKKVLTP